MALLEVRAGSALISRAERKVSLSEIPIEDFENPFEGELKTFSPIEIPTRASFTSTNIEFFAMSRGYVSEHILLLDWTKIHLGVNMYSSMNNYLRAGGWRCLSEKEQSLITDKYKSVKRHHDITNMSFGDNFDSQISALTSEIFLRDKRNSDFTKERIEATNWQDFPGLISRIISERKARTISFQHPPQQV